MTDPLFNADSPAWDPDGKYLYFMSDREFAPQLSTVEFNFATNRTTGLFALALRKDVQHPFPPESDEVKIGRQGRQEGRRQERRRRQAEAAKTDAAKPDARPTTEDHGAGAGRQRAGHRLRRPGRAASSRVPLPADNYDGLAANKAGLIYTVGRRRLLRPRQRSRDARSRFYAFKDRKETTLVADMSGYALSADGAKLLVAPGQRRLEQLRDLRRHGERRRIEEAGVDRRADGRPRAGGGVGPDLRRGVAPLPRLLLRREHARLRLGGAAQAVRAAGRRTSRTAPT